MSRLKSTRRPCPSARGERVNAQTRTGNSTQQRNGMQRPSGRKPRQGGFEFRRDRYINRNTYYSPTGAGLSSLIAGPVLQLPPFHREKTSPAPVRERLRCRFTASSAAAAGGGSGRLR